jgi:hypothetical protein
VSQKQIHKNKIKEKWLEFLQQYLKMFVERASQNRSPFGKLNIVEVWETLINLVKWHFDDGLLPKFKFIDFLMDCVKLCNVSDPQSAMSLNYWLYVCAVFANSICLSRSHLNVLWDKCLFLVHHFSRKDEGFQDLVAAAGKLLDVLRNQIGYDIHVDQSKTSQEPLETSSEAKLLRFIELLDEHSKFGSTVENQLFKCLEGSSSQVNELVNTFYLNNMFKWAVSHERAHSSYTVFTVHCLMSAMLRHSHSTMQEKPFSELIASKVVSFLETIEPSSEIGTCFSSLSKSY